MEANPVSLTDPTGEIAVAIPIIITGVRIGWTAYRAYRTASAIASAVKSTNASQAKTCPPGGNSDNKDPCEEIRKKIRDLEAQLAKKRADLTNDQYDLYNTAYSENPGGDIATKGTFVGHVNRIIDLRIGVERAIAQAKAMGCL